MDNIFEIMLNPEKFGYIQCPHCNGYDSSLKDSEGVNIVVMTIEKACWQVS